jgi:sulfonate transport system substrate-binding protein
MSGLTLPPIAVHGNKHTFEIAPVLLAAEKYYSGEATVKMGGIPNLFGLEAIPGFGENGVADVATHAETQALRYSVANPDLRIILTVAEGLYRLAARRSAGIAKVADLKGKRIATILQTSSGYFLSRLLASAGMSLQDVEVVKILPLSEMSQALASGEVDAVTIWEPYMEDATAALGSDVIEFSGNGIYREIFNLNSTAANLADPQKRAKIVEFVRSVIDATAKMRDNPALAWPLVHASGGHAMEVIEKAWPHHSYPAQLAPDLLDVLTEEERWLARMDGRQARSRDQLAQLIDPSIAEEAARLRD